ncbi:CaiB/BaiF CoA transferase family protein [Marinobacter sp. F3R11]|uniref:CaiB/BaiF CoA transferase family protein n=1 Tax=Marinobacter sp. F3R11 TaxID=2267231 RepID=UPI000DE96762|nr:CaiB/BaiF CoA-transferase family protein [Marinobacter sp. F3R11]RBW51245.1 CoA transferase [Marinobacter sp. F3R11]
MAGNSRKPLPLEGVTVVSLEQAIAAPLCTRQLAEQGARVIKVERPDGGDFARGYDDRANGLSSHFVWANRSKESLTLNLKAAEGQEILHRLLAQADVLVQNLAPGATARMGLSFDELHEQYPQLIVCDVSGYGDGGTHGGKKAYDLLIQSESGFLSVTGAPDADGMAKAGCSVADIAAGMYASNSVLSALLLRARTGEGSHIDVSMLESLVEWMGYPMYYSYRGAPQPARTGASHSTIYPYGPFPVGDGKTVMLGLQNDREWQVFCELVLERPELARDELYLDNPRRSANRDQLGALIREVFSGMTLDEVVRRLDSAGIANASVNNMAQVWNHPQLAARDRWVEVATPAGPLPALKSPGLCFPDAVSAVPELGEHNAGILGELGIGQDRIRQLQHSGVIGH